VRLNVPRLLMGMVRGSVLVRGWTTTEAAKRQVTRAPAGVESQIDPVPVMPLPKASEPEAQRKSLTMMSRHRGVITITLGISESHTAQRRGPWNRVKTSERTCSSCLYAAWALLAAREC
jgi:hypothetical protein